MARGEVDAVAQEPGQLSSCTDIKRSSVTAGHCIMTATPFSAVPGRDSAGREW